MAHPPIEGETATIRVGLQTGEDYRFLRQWWEVPTSFVGPNASSLEQPISHGVLHKALREQVSQGCRWVPYSKTDFASPWYSPLLQVVDWKDGGTQFFCFVDSKGKLRSRPQNLEFYLRPGFSYMLRSNRIIPFAVPSGVIPTAGRAQAFPINGDVFLAFAICASNIGSAVARFSGEKFAWPKFQASMVQGIPSVELPTTLMERLKLLIHSEIAGRRSMFQRHEPFLEFMHPSLLSSEGVSFTLNRESLLGPKLEKEIAAAYGLSEEQLAELERDIQEAVSCQTIGSGTENDENKEDTEGESIIDDGEYERLEGIASYAIGSALGRWDILYATGERQPPELPAPFDPLPVCPPGMLQNADGLPASESEVPDDYPLRISWPGILVDDEGHPEDIITRVREALSAIWKDNASSIEQEACDILKVKSLRDYFAEKKSGGKFFKDHLKRYSKSRRKAPIYWPLSSESGSYTLWTYYHRLTDQTLYQCVSDFIEPKIEQCEKDLQMLNQQFELGQADGKTNDQISELKTLINELKNFRDELLNVARLPYKPNLNDGVQITAAPLWKCFRLGAWQKTLKDTWKK
jgi:hypothetical protein